MQAYIKQLVTECISTSLYNQVWTQNRVEDGVPFLLAMTNENALYGNQHTNITNTRNVIAGVFAILMLFVSLAKPIETMSPVLFMTNLASLNILAYMKHMITMHNIISHETVFEIDMHINLEIVVRKTLCDSYQLGFHNIARNTLFILSYLMKITRVHHLDL